VPALSQLFDAFAAGVYLLFGALHLDLWLRRRDRRSHLWFALACAGALGVDLSGLAIGRAGAAPALWLAVVNLVAVAFASVCLLELVLALTGRAAGRAARALEAGALAAGAAAALSGRAELFAATLAACAALLAWAMALAFRAARSGDPEAGLVGRGFVVLALCLLADLAMELDLLPARPGLPILGFLVLFLASARALNDRADREQRELEQLRRDLEQRVEARTRELSEANLRLAEASRTDALTGLPNRRGFVEACEGELRRSQRSERPLAVVLADVDHFKRVNDSHGHAAGDEALRVVAARIRGALRAQDVVARWGGEEFILLLPETDAEGAACAAEAIRAAVGGRPIEAGGGAHALTLSLGVATHAAAASLDSTIAAADAALYSAKAAGRDRVMIHRSAAAEHPPLEIP